MNTYRVKKVENASDIIAFHRLPLRIYRNDSNWVPHIRQDVESVFDTKKNKYFTHGVCERWLLLDDSNRVQGRIAAFINHKKAYTFKQPTGGIGFFECIDDYIAARTLFDHAKEWLQQQGMKAMDGPVNFGENNKYWGLLIDNFDFPTYHGQNYNPAYYKKFFEDYGFGVYYYQVINYRKLEDPLPVKYKEKAAGILSDPAYSIETIRAKNIEKYAEDFRSVYNAAWTTHDNFKAMPQEMAMSIFKKMKRVIDERLVCFVYHNGKPVAFCLCIPDLNQLFRYVYGNLDLLGKIKFVLAKIFTRVTRINGVAIGVHPEYQKKGVEGAIFTEMSARLQNKTHYKDVVVTWVGDFNPKMQYIFEDVGFTPRSRMATYRKLFDPNAVFERSPIISK